MKINNYCVMCGKGMPHDLQAGINKRIRPATLKKRMSAHGWIVQFNGEHIDTYCSWKCAR